MSAIVGPSLTAGRSSLRNPLRLLVSAEPWLALIFALLSFVLGVLWFTVLVTLLSAGIGMAITLVGLPLLAGTMLLWTSGARLERARVRALLGVKIENPYRPLPAGSIWPRLKVRLADPHTWLDLLYLFLLFPIGIAEFVIAVVMVSVVAAAVTMPAYYRAAPIEIFNGQPVDTLPKALATALLGLSFLVALPYVLVGLGRGHAWLAGALLGVNREAELNARVGQLSESRSRAMDAAVVELQRIERDLHDGAQQRLVKLGMDLGMAREKLKTDPAAAEALIAEAHDETKRVMAEIRDLARGILPAVLTDRGLDAAISALAGRSTVPVSVDVLLPERLRTPVETTAYFVVAEALTNVARHSQATEAQVIVRRDGDRLEIDVVDDGAGGADPGMGSGLAGLQDRLAALDGTLTVVSPVGGPTRVHAEIPCG
ncbi:MAG TPA: sensor domain-containing protein [Thermomicrobiaceae bacterium]|nr:sensor domain-containing protein [Thermomicrobiaceae bacterium]